MEDSKIHADLIAAVLTEDLVIRMDWDWIQFKCPYCERKSASPGGVRFHVKLMHPEKLEEFNNIFYDYYLSKFNEALSHE